MKNWRMVLFAFLLAIVFLITTVFHYILIASHSLQSEETSEILTERVYAAVEEKLQVPIVLAKTMATDTLLLELMEEEDAYSMDDMVDKVQQYLEGFKESADCDSAFVVSESSKRYYSYEGLNKIVNPSGDTRDIWYSLFVNGGEPYALDVDVDEVSDLKWTIFVNARMEDARGKLLGVCGVGVVMSDVQKLFEEYENRFGIKLNLVDSDGLVQADVNTVNIETTYHTKQILSATDDYIYTQKGNNGYIVTKYIEELDWYLVLQDDEDDWVRKEFDATFLILEVVCFLVVAIVFLVMFRNAGKRKRGFADSQTDALTGLPNRNYFKEVYGERGIFNTTRYKAIAVFDIDFFKEANDTMDGDAVLRFVTDCAKQIMGEKAEIFRWGGDEFAALLEWPIESAYEVCRQFCKEVEKGGQVTVSVGVTEVRLSDTIKKNYYRAAQGCYLVKEMGGNSVKRN